jgi:hypothetical protein
MRRQTKTDILAEEFLEKAKLQQTNVEPVKVLKARVYQIGDANVLIRAASEGNNNYFLVLITSRLRKLPISIILLLLLFVVQLTKH